MEILEYLQLPEPEKALAYLAGCEWSAGRFLAKLIKSGTLEEKMGEGARVFFLMNGSEVVTFATYSRKDAIADDALYPWIGFVYTDARYRGHRYSQQIIDHALAMARAQGHERVYLTSNHIGLYEKYGFVYLENRVDVWGEDSRIYFYPIKTMA